jgi:hypothetical protein
VIAGIKTGKVLFTITAEDSSKNCGAHIGKEALSLFFSFFQTFLRHIVPVPTNEKTGEQI